MDLNQLPGNFAQRVETQSADDLRRAGSLKWTGFAPADGAWVAEMDFGLATPIKQAISEFVENEMTGYAPFKLRDGLKTATAEWLDQRYGWQVDSSRIYWLPDVLTGLTMLLSYLAPAGDVIVPTPAYMPFIDIPGACGRKTIQVAMIQTGNTWVYDFEAIEKAFQDGAKVLVLCNPHNPIGKVTSVDEMTKLTAIVERYDGLVFSDEIHAPLVFDGVHVPYASTSQSAARHTITALSASKSFNTAGLKCAQLVATNDEHHHWLSNQGHGIVHESAPIGMVAAITAYQQGQEWLTELIEYLRANRDFAIEMFGQLIPEIKIIKPEATFLMWLDCRQLGLEDARQYFLDAGVALTDGAECGDAGRGWLRLCFATPRPVLAQIITKMADAIHR